MPTVTPQEAERVLVRWKSTIRAFCWTACRRASLPLHQVVDLVEQTTSCLGERLLQLALVDGQAPDDCVERQIKQCSDAAAKRDGRLAKRRVLESDLAAVADEGGSSFLAGVPTPGDDNPLDALLRSERIACVRRCVSRLPEHLRKVMEASMYAHESGQTIAAGFRITPSAVSQRIKTAIKSLRGCLEAELGEPYGP